MRPRITPRMCMKTGGEAADGHTHVCMRNALHGGKHHCMIGTDKGMCGHSW